MPRHVDTRNLAERRNGVRRIEKPHSCEACENITIQETDVTESPHEVILSQDYSLALQASEKCIFYRDLLRLLKGSKIQTGSPITARFDMKRGVYLRLTRNEALRVYSLGQGNISSQYFPVADVRPDVKSERAFAQAKRWIQECYSNHRFCQVIQTGFAPTRLLEVGAKGATHVRLIETAEMQNVRWASLSYVWGGPQKVRTTTLTLPIHRKGIKIASLPRTLVDAIAVCRELSVDYLWIDALCIIQDDKDDLDRELGSMPQIYQESYVTIMGAKAAAVEEGFLNDTALYTYDSFVPTQIKYKSHDGKVDHILLCQADHHQVLLGDPINSRAWTYQELLLSPRLLRYGRDFMRWSCRSCKLYDGNWKKQNRILNSDAYDWNVGDIPCVPGRPMPAWEPIIETYSKRDMTVLTDKLPAISAIAQVYAKTNKHTYVAGLWKETLPLGLCWMVGQDKKKRRPQEFRAPTWSWASINSPIKFVGDWYRGMEETRDGINGGLIGVTTVADMVEILDVTVVPTKPGREYTSIESATLTLKGAIRPVEWYIDYTSGVGSVYASGIDVDETLFTGYADAWEDNWPTEDAVSKHLESQNEQETEDDDDESGSDSSEIIYDTLEVFALLVSKSRSYDHGYGLQDPNDDSQENQSTLERSGLLLVKDEARYKRVGFLRWYVDEAMYDCEAVKLPGFAMQTVTIF